jgi:hypothetical protein
MLRIGSEMSRRGGADNSVYGAAGVAVATSRVSTEDDAGFSSKESTIY